MCFAALTGRKMLALKLSQGYACFAALIGDVLALLF